MDRLKPKRTVLRGRTTRIVNEGKTLLSTANPSAEDLTVLLDRLTACSTELQGIDDQLETLFPVEELEQECENCLAYRDEVNRVVSQLNFKLRQANCPSSTSVLSSTEFNAQATQRTAHSGIKLPKLHLQKFNGEPTQWPSFWEQYQSSIHENSTLSKVEKFQYLRWLLEGPAYAVIDGLQPTESCYDDALDLLKKRFGDKRKIEQEYFSRLRQLAHVRSSRDTAGLRNMYDRIQSSMRGLKVLGVAAGNYASMMYDIVLEALPQNLVLDFYRKEQTQSEQSRTPEDQLEELLRFFQTEVESREKLGVSVQTDGANKGNGNRRNRPSGLVLQTMTQSSKCLFCDSSTHGPESCSSDLDLTARKEKLKSQRRCFRCTWTGHMAGQCKRRVKCDKCQGRHVTSMCDPNYKPKKPASTETQAHSTVITSSAAASCSTVLLQAFRAWVVTRQKCAYVRGMFDSGSQSTFVREDLVRDLKLHVLREEEISISTFASPICKKPEKRRIVELHIRSQYAEETIKIEAIEVPILCHDVPDISAEDRHIIPLEESGEHIADVVSFPGVPQVDGISLLVGADQMWKLVKGEIRRYGPNGAIVAINSKLGWTFQGPTTERSLIARQDCNHVSVLHVGTLAEDTRCDQLFERFCSLEGVGIVDEYQSSEKDVVLEEFEKTVKLKEGRYEVKLPWKPVDSPMSDNYDVAETRLKKLVLRLSKDRNAIEEYDKVIRGYLQGGYAEEVPINSRVEDQRVYYMPHREVIREASTTTKLRVVFDASSHGVGSTSLNDHLQTGPKLQADIQDILIRFRLHQIAMVADIEKAFLQIDVEEKDRDALRYLWFREVPYRERTSNEITVLRMKRVPFGTTASPFLLAATLYHHLHHVQDDLKGTASILLSSFYVDDLVTGADSIEEATRLHQQALEIMDQAGMRLRKWTSNEPQLRSLFTEKNISDGTTEGMTKVLGVPWDTDTDRLMVSLDSVLKFVSSAPISKRNVLQGTARLFDPLGFINPFTFRARSIFQGLWKDKVSWDEDVPCDVQRKWIEWCSELSVLSTLKIPRSIVPADSMGIQIHVFCDASPLGYGAVAYLRATTTNGAIVTQLLMSKARLAPIKQLSLPRLELMGMVIGARMLKYLQRVLDGLQFDYFMWTDSMIALGWIHRPPTDWKVFVGNRVRDVQEHTDTSRWAHCPGSENPADFLTRGMNGRKLADSRCWWHGPQWLDLDSMCWPKTEVERDSRLEEERRERRTTVQAAVSKLCPPLDLEKFSDYSRALRTTAWIFRFVGNCRGNQERTTGPLTAEELLQSERYWVRTSQAESYPTEIYSLRQDLGLPKDSKIADLDPFLNENGILRLGGRLHYADEAEEIRHPIIISKGHRLAELIVWACHRRTLHGGLQDTMNDLREKWWIPQARQFVKTVIHRCATCKRFRLQAATAPTGPLPAERVTRTSPFEVVGVDFVGPVYLKTDGGSSKAYIALFTCAVTRAVHFELITSLATKAFLHAFRRFVARRGIPTLVYSDNALTFKRAAKDIQKLGRLLQQDEVRSHMANKMITWKFIPERAAWWGGFWERLVRTLKHALRRVVGRQSLTTEEMETVLAEAEAAVNSRPITYLHSSPTENVALTPAHFLAGRRLLALPGSPAENFKSTVRALTRRWIHQQKVSDHFWKRWSRDYLLQLRSAHLSKRAPSHDLQEGDLVLVHDEKMPRQVWKSARILKLHPGRDGQSRLCSIKLPSGHISRRPVQRLYPFEVHLQCASGAHSGGEDVVE